MKSNNILIIDDDYLMHEMIKTNMQIYNIKTTHSYNHLQTHEILKEKIPDLILLDVLLPGLSGLEYLSYLKYNLLQLEVPVILMSVLDNQEIKETGFKLGAKEYFCKPLNFSKLFNSINKHLKTNNEESIFI